jgi:ribonucleoside-diphosphate reductase alpha chain
LEIPLSPYDSCRLIASNLYSLVKDPFTTDARIDTELAYKVFYETQILCDTLVDLEISAVDEIIKATEGKERELWTNISIVGFNGRRTGGGILGYGDMCAALNIPYGEPSFTDYIMKLKQTAELDATIDLAIINGPFPAYNKDLEYETIVKDGVETFKGKNSWFKFLQNTYPVQFKKMLNYGRRNISFSTIAPTGSISILTGTSSGCEPVFSLYYTRRKKCNAGETPDFVDANGIGFRNFNVIHDKFKEWYTIVTPTSDIKPLEEMSKEELEILIKKSPWYNNTAEDIDPKHRVETQAILQKYTTHSISSTVNVAENVDSDYIKTIYEHAWNKNLKGITVYRDNCRSGILIKNVPQKETVATTRPIELKCKVSQFKNEKKDWIALVGLLDDAPYEIFTGIRDIDEFPIPSNITEGIIIKVRQDDGTSRYDFRYVDSYGYTNTLGGLSRVFDKEYWNYGRMVSGYLRSHIPVHEIVSIIDGLTFTNKGLNNWKSGVIRSLKEFIIDGTKVEGETCENCGSTNIVYDNGCKICRDCLVSKCG